MKSVKQKRMMKKKLVKAGLWQLGFSDAVKNGTIFSKILWCGMVLKFLLFFYCSIIFTSMYLVCALNLKGSNQFSHTATGINIFCLVQQSASSRDCNN